MLSSNRFNHDLDETEVIVSEISIDSPPGATTSSDPFVIPATGFTLTGTYTDSLGLERSEFLTSLMLEATATSDANPQIAFPCTPFPFALNSDNSTWGPITFANMTGGSYDLVVSIQSGGQGANNIHIVIAPVMISLSQTQGPASASILITITGTGLTGVTSVNFGSNTSITPSSVTDTAVTFWTPMSGGTVGSSVSISVTRTTSQASTTVTSNSLTFTYTAALYALQFDGATQYVDMGNSTTLQITRAITLAAWVSLTSFPAQGSGRGYQQVGQ